MQEDIYKTPILIDILVLLIYIESVIPHDSPSYEIEDGDFHGLRLNQQ